MVLRITPQRGLIVSKRLTPTVRVSVFPTAGYTIVPVIGYPATVIATGQPVDGGGLINPEVAFSQQQLTVWTAVELVYSLTTSTDPTDPGATFTTSDPDTTVVVPDGMHTMKIDWLIAGGGSGGWGVDLGLTRGGGSGGGSGDFRQTVALAVSPGDIITIHCGRGGAQTSWTGGPTNGADGFDSWLLVNGVEMLRVYGGLAGKGYVSGQPPAGGQGGQPFGTNGASGTIGVLTLPANGGDGGSGPTGTVGGKGGIANTGSIGLNPGAGGGGGGARQASPNHWAGGAGAAGYCEYSFIEQRTQFDPTDTTETYVCRLVDSVPAGIAFNTDGSNTTHTFASYDPIFGSLSSLSAMTEGPATSSPRLTINFFPPSAEGISFVDDPAQQGARVRVWTGTMDPITGQVTTALLKYTGYVDTCKTTFQLGSSSLSMEVGSIWELLFSTSEGQRLNRVWHQTLYPGETGLDDVIESTGTAWWGIASVAAPYRQVPLSPTVGDRIAGNGSGGLSSGQSPYG